MFLNSIHCLVIFFSIFSNLFLEFCVYESDEAFEHHPVRNFYYYCLNVTIYCQCSVYVSVTL